MNCTSSRECVKISEGVMTDVLLRYTTPSFDALVLGQKTYFQNVFWTLRLTFNYAMIYSYQNSDSFISKQYESIAF